MASTPAVGAVRQRGYGGTGMERQHRYQATVTAKGQLTVPADLRKELGLRQGDRVEFAQEEPGVYTVRRVVDETGIDRAIELWQKSGPPLHCTGSEFVEEVRGPVVDQWPPRRRSER